MSQQILQNEETLGVIRNKINDNFSEVYSLIYEISSKLISQPPPPTPTPEATPEATPEPTPIITPPTPLLVNTDFEIIDVESSKQYYFKIADEVSTFSLLIDSKDGVSFYNLFDPTDFNNCRLEIYAANHISCSASEVYVTNSVELSTDTNQLFTFTYFNTGSVIAGFTTSNNTLTEPTSGVFESILPTPTATFPEETPLPTPTPTLLIDNTSYFEMDHLLVNCHLNNPSLDYVDTYVKVVVRDDVGNVLLEEGMHGLCSTYIFEPFVYATWSGKSYTEGSLRESFYINFAKIKSELPLAETVTVYCFSDNRSDEEASVYVELEAYKGGTVVLNSETSQFEISNSEVINSIELPLNEIPHIFANCDSIQSGMGDVLFSHQRCSFNLFDGSLTILPPNEEDTAVTFLTNVELPDADTIYFTSDDPDSKLFYDENSRELKMSRPEKVKDLFIGIVFNGGITRPPEGRQLDLTNWSGLKYVSCEASEINLINLTGCTSLLALNAPINPLTEIIGQCDSLLKANLLSTLLSSSDFTGTFPNLTDLSFFSNNLEVIDLTPNTFLKRFSLVETADLANWGAENFINSPTSLTKIILDPFALPDLNSFELSIGKTVYVDSDWNFLGMGELPNFDGIEITESVSMFDNLRQLVWCDGAKDYQPLIDKCNGLKIINMYGVNLSSKIFSLDSSKIFAGSGTKEINLVDCYLQGNEIDDIFMLLPDINSVYGNGEIYLYGNPGDTDCNKSLAIEKGWRVNTSNTTNRLDTYSSDNLIPPPIMVESQTSKYENTTFNSL